jgi:ABC-type oligopeptide transport system ATPase subunit
MTDLLRIEDLVVAFADRHRPGGMLRAVDGVSLSIGTGEILGLVGESGSGKTTLGKALLRLYEPASGRILLGGVDLTHLNERALRPHRRQLQMVFQDPLSSFNPRHTIGEAIATPLRLHRLCAAEEVAAEVGRILRDVGLNETFMGRYPNQMSGGQLQRAAIGRALAVSPALIVADEAVSKLDVSVRAQVLNLLRTIHAQRGLSMLFITHDLHVARFLCHRIGVMQAGRLVEIGATDEVYGQPRHAYTQALLATIAPMEAKA